MRGGERGIDKIKRETHDRETEKRERERKRDRDSEQRDRESERDSKGERERARERERERVKRKKDGGWVRKSMKQQRKPVRTSVAPTVVTKCFTRRRSFDVSSASSGIQGSRRIQSRTVSESVNEASKRE